MCRSMVDIQSPTADIRREIKKRKIEDRKKPQGKNIMSASATQGGHKKLQDKYIMPPLLHWTAIITNGKSYMNFRLVPKSVTLNDLERRNDPYFGRPM